MKQRNILKNLLKKLLTCFLNFIYYLRIDTILPKLYNIPKPLTFPKKNRTLPRIENTNPSTKQAMNPFSLVDHDKVELSTISLNPPPCSACESLSSPLNALRSLSMALVRSGVVSSVRTDAILNWLSVYDSQILEQNDPAFKLIRP